MRKRRVVVLGALVVVLAAAVVLAVQVFAVTPIARPSAGATPREMTITYLRAARAHDCALTHALTTPHTVVWCSGPLAYLHGEPDLREYGEIGHADFVPKAEAGTDEECVSSAITQSNMSGMRAGSIRWNWCWTRTAHGWRLYDQGQG